MFLESSTRITGSQGWSESLKINLDSEPVFGRPWKVYVFPFLLDTEHCAPLGKSTKKAESVYLWRYNSVWLHSCPASQSFKAHRDGELIHAWKFGRSLALWLFAQ